MAEPVTFFVDAWGDPVGVGVTGARYCTVGAVCKQGSPNQLYGVANEYLCGRLAAAAGLPVPPGGLVKLDDGSWAFISLRFGDKGERPPPAIMENVVGDMPRVAAGVAVFDVWIVNGDRHQENMAYDRGSLPLVIFDHERALLGTNQGVARLQDAAGKVAVAGQLHYHLMDGAAIMAWCDRIGGVPAPLVEEASKELETVGLLTAEEAYAVAGFLKERKGQLADLIAAEQDAFPRVTEWGFTL